MPGDPTSRSPGTTVSTPAGSTWLSTQPSARTDSVVFSEGLTMTALPIRSAGAICQMLIIIGQFHGPIAPTIPTGRHVSVARVPPLSVSSTTVSSGTSRDAAVRSHAEHAPTSKRAFGPLSGLPVSRLSSSASGPATASTASAARFSTSARSAEDQDAHSGWMSLATATASSTSSAP